MVSMAPGDIAWPAENGGAYHGRTLLRRDGATISALALASPSIAFLAQE
jgi:hypothetical protein